MGKQHGYDFEKEIGKSFELLKLDSRFKNLWYNKLVDTYAYDWVKDYMGDMAEHPKSLDVKRTAQSKYTMILPKVPADFLLLHKGITAYIECKSSQDDHGFPIGNIKQHQLDSSYEIEMAGAPFYFFICKREARNNVLYIVTGSKMRHTIQVLKEAKIIKSKIPWATIQAQAINTIPKSRGCVYDLKCLFV